MTQPLVSIVIATYRSRHDHLSAALNSALNQSWRHIEVIVSDDSPDDQVQAFARSFTDDRLHYRRNVPALGVAGNHWAAFAQARGEYLVILNHDDWLSPSFVACMVDVLEHAPQAVLAFCDHWIVDVRGRRLVEETERASQAWGRQALEPGLHRPFVKLVDQQSIPIAMGTMFRRRALPKLLPEHAGPAYDLWLSYLLARGGAGAFYVPQRLSAWRSHGESVSSQVALSWLEGTASCWHAVARDPTFRDVRASARRKAALGSYACAVRCWAMGQRWDCLRYAVSSLLGGWSLKALVACFLPLLPIRWAPAKWVRSWGVA